MVLSEIHSNPEPRGITSGFADAATAALPLLRTTAPLTPEKIIWIAHHGPFSSFENVGPDSFTRVDLIWEGERYTTAPTPAGTC